MASMLLQPVMPMTYVCYLATPTIWASFCLSWISLQMQLEITSNETAKTKGTILFYFGNNVVVQAPPWPLAGQQLRAVDGVA